MLILAAFMLVASNKSQNKQIEIQWKILEGEEVAYDIQSTEDHTEYTAFEESWRNSPYNKLTFTLDMKDGTHTRSLNSSEFFVLHGMSNKEILVKELYNRRELKQGYNETVKEKSKLEEPTQYGQYLIDDDGFVYFSPKKPDQDDIDKEAQLRISDLHVSESLILNLPKQLQKIGNKQNFEARCLYGLMLHDSRHVYESSGSSLLKDIHQDSKGHVIATIQFTFSETVNADKFNPNENPDQKILIELCNVKALGQFDVTAGYWLDIIGVYERFSRYGTEGYEEKNEFKILKLDTPPKRYNTVKEMVENMKRWAPESDGIVFKDFFETGAGSLLKIKNCNKDTPEYDEKKCYKNRELKWLLMEEQEEINAYLAMRISPILIKYCKCQKPENFDDFESEALPKWKYINCLAECKKTVN